MKKSLQVGLILAFTLAPIPRPRLSAKIPEPVWPTKQLEAQSLPPVVLQDAEEEAWRMHEQASELARLGKYDEAIALELRALSKMEAAVGIGNVRYSKLLNDLALLYFHKGDYTQAEQAFKQLVTVAEGLVASDPSLVATARNNLGVAYSYQGKYALAESELEEARRIRERVLGAGHPEVGVTLTYLGQVQFQKGEYVNAERTYERALTMLKADNYRFERAILLNNMGLVHVMTGRLDQAAHAFEQSLAIHRALGQDANSEVATVMGNLAAVYKAKGEYVNAERMYKEVLGILEKLWGTSHVEIARWLVNLSAVYVVRANYLEAEKALLRALEIYKNVPGVNPESIVIAKNDLGLVYRLIGRSADSKGLFVEVLAFYEKEFGPRHLKTAAPLNNLALLSQDTGEYDKARELFRRVIDIYENSTGVDPSLTATALQNHVSLDLIFGDYSSSAQKLEKAREILVKAHGTNHPMVATVVNNQGVVAEAQGDYASATRMYEQALDLRLKVLDAGHPDIAGTLNNLGLLLYKNGDYGKAETLLRRAVKMLEEAGLDNHPDFASALANHAFVLLAQGNAAEAVKAMVRSTDLSERHLGRLVAVGSSSQKRLYAESLLTATSGVITLHLSLAPTNPEAARLALTTVLRRKGRVLDTMIDQLASLRRRLKPQDQVLLEKLRSVNSQLSTLMRRDPGGTDAPQSGEEMTKLEAEAGRLEAQLSASSAELGAQLQPVTLTRVRQALPPDAALVEFVWYRPLNVNAKKGTDRFDVPRYAAYVLRREGEPGFVDLGQAPLIELVLFRLRAALRNPERFDVRRIARVLDKSLMQPVRKLLGGEDRIFLSPDGALNLIPFGALVDEQDRYLIERYEFTYLTSGRDLLRGHSQFQGKQPALVIANPLFDDSGTDRTAGLTREREQVGKSSRVFQTNFDPLKGTEEEARQVGELLKVMPITGAQATESALKGASGPRILHIATHGYFLPYQEPEATKAEGFDPFRLTQFRAVEESKSPLLRSGLAFAGANRPEGSGGEDGVLTALEAAGLDLWGTKLVVLSACETGLGDVQLGEGVYGLRRSFMLAGAESAVMSFWKVDDEITRDIMVHYYKRLLDGEGRSQALRQVELRILGDHARSHPYYWASFIHLGDWQGMGSQMFAPR